MGEEGGDGEKQEDEIDYEETKDYERRNTIRKSFKETKEMQVILTIIKCLKLLLETVRARKSDG
jgi:hypothetical protein